MSTESDHYTGRRLSYDGALCTVRFIGQVQGTKGEWLGVEWDHDERGKHNGEHGGVRYFECRSRSPTCGSFVRPTRPHAQRRTFVEALRDKYASDQLYDVDTDLVRISGKTVEEVGFEKIRKQQAELQKLRVVLLDGLCIGDDGMKRRPSAVAQGVADACPDCIELDLSRNLFEDWSEILDIITQLPKLTRLVIDGNRFTMSALNRSAVFDKGLPELKTLNLNHCLVNGSEVAAFCSFFPSVEALSADNNELQGFHFPGRLLRYMFSLRQLSLEGNDIQTLSNLRDLTGLPVLQGIFLKNNDIAHTCSIEADGESRPIVFSSSITELDLTANQISKWSFLDDLHTIFPGLESIRVSGNPVYDDLKIADSAASDADDAFMFTLARVKKLMFLNHSKVTAKERFNAETYYLSQIGKELSVTTMQDRERILHLHPRYAELCEKYGEPVVIRKTPLEADPNSLGARLVRCNLRLGSSLASREDVVEKPGVLDMDIPRSFTIYNVLGLLGQRLKLAPMSMELIWETGEKNVTASADGDSDSDSDEEAAKSAIKTVKTTEPMLREETLRPLTRRIGTWLEQQTATIRIELHEADQSELA